MNLLQRFLTKSFLVVGPHANTFRWIYSKLYINITTWLLISHNNKTIFLYVYESLQLLVSNEAFKMAKALEPAPQGGRPFAQEEMAQAVVYSLKRLLVALRRRQNPWNCKIQGPSETSLCEYWCVDGGFWKLMRRHSTGLQGIPQSSKRLL